MITLYSGTPGAGKSLHVAKTIYTRLRTTKRDVIATFPINMDIVTQNGKKKTANFIFCDISDMTTEYLIKYALENHKLGKENQTLVVIDECQIIFNPREFSRSDRLKWIVFFTQHRKLGYDFILISQFDRLIDRQIRCLLEYNVVHRKVNNLGILWMLPIKFFIAVNTWYGAKVKCGQQFFMYRKKYGKMYDSFMMFDDDFRKYIKDSGEKVSDYNLKKLGIDKPEKEKNLDNEENAVNGIDIIDNEISRYTNIFNEATDISQSREIIETEVAEVFEAIKNDLCKNPNCSTCLNPCAMYEKYKQADKSENGAVAPPAELGGGGVPPMKQSAQAKPITKFSRLKGFFGRVDSPVIRPKE